MYLLKKGLLIISFLCLFSFVKDSLHKKIIYDSNFLYEFYVFGKESKSVDITKRVYWFRGGKIHFSNYASGGYLLQDKFFKFYRSEQLAEKGFFEEGLKKGEWIEWYENGNLKKISEWKNGLMNGIFFEFDSTGKKITEGSYKNNLKHGKWIDFKKKDTVSFKSGKIIINETTDDPSAEEKQPFFKRIFKKKDTISKKEESFFKRIFKKKDSTTTQKNKVKIISQEKKIKKKPLEPKKKEHSFFKKLFRKKEKNNLKDEEKG